MASSAKFLCFLFLLFLVSSLQIHARDSQFFSKVSPTNNNVKETELPWEEIDPLNQEEEPRFTPESHNGYGLYGRDMDQFPSTTPTNFPQKTPNGGENSEYAFTNGYPSNSNHNNNNNAHETKEYSLSDTRYQGNDDNNNDNNAHETKEYSLSDTRYQDNNNGYETKQNSLTRYRENFNNDHNNNNKNQYPTKQQGMSDTRFLENGKYFYDLNNENSYRNAYQSTRRNDVFGSSSSRGVNSRNHYGDNEKLYKFNNYMENQENPEYYVP